MRQFSNLLLAVVLGMTVIGCVKEHRDMCPCRLSLDFSRLDTSLIKSARVNVVGPGGYVHDESVGRGQFAEDLQISVPKGGCMLCVYSGEQGMASPDKGLFIPYGEDCPPVHMCAAYLDTECESYRKVVVLRKNYCRLSVLVEDPEHFAFGLAVRGSVSGYGADGAPVKGDFFYDREPFADDEWVMSVPRQTDDSMTLEVNDGTSVLKTFALGEYIRASVYDWNALDLGDITVGIDYTRTKMTIMVQGWDEVYEFDVVI